MLLLAPAQLFASAAGCMSAAPPTHSPSGPCCLHLPLQAQFDPSTAARLAEASVGYSQARRRMGLSRQRDLTQIP